MKKFLLLSAGLAALSGTMLADSIWYGSGSTASTLVSVGSTATFVSGMASFPAGSPYGNTQTPFWNNPSGDVINSDTNHTNVGDVLSGYSTGTNLIGSNLTGSVTAPLQTTGTINGSYLAYASSGIGDPVNNTTTSGNVNINGGGLQAATEATNTLEFSFQTQQTAYTIALLFADSGLDTGCLAGSNCTSAGGIGTTFGVYTETASGSGVFTFTPITTPGNNTSGTATTIATNDVLDSVTNGVYGFYATVCYAYSTTAGVSTCTSSVTYTTGAGNFSTNASGNNYLNGLGWNHFALFELANGEEVIGFEDSPWTPGSTPNGGEGIGDFNDIIIALTPPLTAPEPGTIAIMGLGLAGLGLVSRRRFAKK